MMLKECRCCGYQMTFSQGGIVAECAACGTKNEAPRISGVMLDNFRRAIRQQADGDFYNAEISYQYVLNSCPDDPEALWGRLVCHYGAALVEHRNRRLWEIHMTRNIPLREQGDFRRACELAQPEVRRQYESDAAYIDNAMARIRELAESCPPYDVFLCHKTTTLDGAGYTEDYNRAYALYRLLSDQGYRVFFAPVELEGVAGEDYEAGIYHALHTAKVMLVVCSDPRHLTSLWVQSEWKRYLERVDRGEDAHVIPLMYGSLEENRLPQEFRNRRLQAIRMELNGKEAVLEAVGRYIKKRKSGRLLPVLLMLVLLLLAGGYFVYRQMQPERRESGIPAAAPQGTPGPAQYQYEKSAPTVTQCPHDSTTPEYGKTQYWQMDGNTHYCITPVTIRCEDCDELIDQYNDDDTEAHTYKSGSSICTLCGYERPVPAVTPCPHSQTTESVTDTRFQQMGEETHYRIQKVQIKCAYCGEEIDRDTREAYLSHAYNTGSNVCVDCKYVKPTPTPTAPRTTKTWEVYWSDVGVSAHNPGDRGTHIGGVDEGVYPGSWEKGRTRFPMGQVICFRGTLLGNGSEQDVQLNWRVVYEGDIVTGQRFDGSSTANSSFIVWVRSQKRGSYRLEIYYFKEKKAHVIGQYEYVLE